MFKVISSLRKYSDSELAVMLLEGLIYEHEGYLLPAVSGEAAIPIWRLSGGSANTNPASSLGGIMSTSTAAGSNLFDDVSGDEAAAGDTEYRGVYVLNNGTVDLQSGVVWIQVNTPDPDTTAAIALAAEGSNATMATIANENTAPPTVTFTSPATKAAGLSIGTLTAGQRYGVWIRRTITAGAAAYNGDTFTIRVEGDTAA
jgi:hypothetical protein